MTRPVIRTGLDFIDLKRVAYPVSSAPIDRVWAGTHKGRLTQYWSRYIEQPQFEALARTIGAREHLPLRDLQAIRSMTYRVRRNRARRRRTDSLQARFSTRHCRN
jgi:hypothetical protein